MEDRRDNNREVTKKPHICSVIYGDSFHELKEMADRANSVGSDIVEVRLDLCKNIAIPPPKLSNLPTILTARSIHEGGRMAADAKRQEIIRSILQSDYDYVDIEISTDASGSEFPSRPHGQIIFSRHWFDRFPPIEELTKLIQEYGEHGIVKLVPTASQFKDNLTILKLVRNYNEQGYKVVSFCMGEGGIISRILSPLAGSLFTYASISKPVAPGQLSTSEVLSIYHAIEY